MFSLEYIILKIRVFFCYLKMNLLCPQREWVLIHRVHHVAPPYFYRSPEWTNQTLPLKRAFCVFFKMRFVPTIGFSYVHSDIHLNAICNFITRCHLILHIGPLIGKTLWKNCSSGSVAEKIANIVHHDKLH